MADDRAARAARAKNLLKKHQREKAGAVQTSPETSSSAGVASPSDPSKPLSPAVPEAVGENNRDLGALFSKDGNDVSWLSSLPRVTSPPASSLNTAHVTQASHATSPPPAPPQTETLNDRISLSASAEDSSALRAHIDSLQFELTSLKGELERLKDLEPKLQDTESLLANERNRASQLSDRLRELEQEKEANIQNERRTIALLVSEKSSLTMELSRLEGIESKAQGLEALLKEEQLKTKNLDNLVAGVRQDIKQAEQVAAQSQSQKKELMEKSRDQERQLQLLNASVAELKQEAEMHQRRVRELEEQIQSDDRVERLEVSLKNTQDRADELEFQLTKLKQAHTTLRQEKDDIDSQRLVSSSKVTELEIKQSELHAVYSGVSKQLATLSEEKDALSQEKQEIQSRLEVAEKTASSLQEKLTQVNSDLAASTRQLQAAHNDLKSANRRVEDAEKVQRDLQAEGTNLMESLNEMRPKIVELTGVRLELSERIDSLERNIQNRDAEIARLEAELEETRTHNEEAERRIQDAITRHEKEQALAQSDATQLHKAYNDLQEELDAATASLRTLETERAGYHQDTTRRIEEIEHLNAISRSQSEEIFRLREELESRHHAQAEEQDYLQEAQNEIEALRGELNAKEHEIERMRDALSSPTRSDGPLSLDEEMLNSLRQQHALDLSAAQSQVRALENSVFDAEARSHALQKQINALEEQLAQSRSRPSSRLGQRSFSPVQRPSSRLKDDLRRSSFGSHRPSNLSRSVFDSNMSAETRHKRIISLSMLKARIESEVAATSRPSSRASSVRPLSPVRDSSLDSLEVQRDYAVHRPQFLDDSHVFWCHSCKGDLVIL